MNIKRLKNGSFEVDEKTLKEFITNKAIVDILRDAEYDISDIENDSKDYIDNFIREIE